MRPEFIDIPTPLPHRLAYYAWGNPQAPETVVCVHGLTRNSRDFDFLAATLSTRYRVICPDIAGRGKSDPLADPAQYHYLTYLSDMQHLLASLGLKRVHWVGTSMGGIIGMMMAGALPGLIQSMTLNDIGCLIPAAGLKRIFSYAGVNTSFPDRASAESALRTNMATFGITDEAHWRHIFEHSLLAGPDGMIRMAYDPLITSGFPKPDAVADVNLWAAWDAVKPLPTLLLRGEHSDILTRETALQMREMHPSLTLHEIPATGHAPMLMQGEQIKLLADWLGRANG